MTFVLTKDDSIVYPWPLPESKRGIKWTMKFEATPCNGSPSAFRLVSGNNLRAGQWCYTHRGQAVEITKIIEGL